MARVRRDTIRTTRVIIEDDTDGYVIELDRNEAAAIEYYLGRSLAQNGSHRPELRSELLPYGSLSAAGLRVFDAMRQARHS